MKKKVLSLVLALSMTASLAGCAIPGIPGQGGTVGGIGDSTVTTEAEVTTAATTEEVTTEATTVADTTETATEAATEAAQPASNRNFDSSFINFDDMHFFINGTKYVLGQNTLQDMIDGGTPFNADDIANAGNNVNKNYESPRFRIELADYYTAQVTAINETENNKPANECILCEVYIPVKQDVQQNIISFDFPLDLTMDELKAACGEPDDYDHWVSEDDSSQYKDTFKYEMASEKYYGSKYYSFEFWQGKLEYVYIRWIP